MFCFIIYYVLVYNITINFVLSSMEGNNMLFNKTMTVLLFSPSIFMFIIILLYKFKDILHELDCEPYNTGVTKPTTYIYDGKQYNIGKVETTSLRASPPKVCFFGHLNGEDFNIEGPLEEKYMSETDLKWYNKKKEQTERLSKIKLEYDNKKVPFNLND